MTTEQRKHLQDQLDGFIWDYILASRERDGVPAERMFWSLQIRALIERRLDQETTP